jgi:hypothetical protein
MVSRISSVMFVLLVFVVSVRAADPQLVQDLKNLGQAVDNMSIHISKSTSDAEAAQIAQAVQQTFAANLSGNPKPQVAFTASAGRCDVLITAPAWRLWSRAENGQVVDHGAKIN